MEICPTLDMIRVYFTKSLQGYQFCCYRNIILDICEEDTPSYNASGRVILEERKIKLEGDIMEAQKAAKLAGI